MKSGFPGQTEAIPKVAEMSANSAHNPPVEERSLILPDWHPQYAEGDEPGYNTAEYSPGATWVWVYSEI
jgi:hypothetical protein